MVHLTSRFQTLQQQVVLSFNFHFLKLKIDFGNYENIDEEGDVSNNDSSKFHPIIIGCVVILIVIIIIIIVAVVLLRLRKEKESTSSK